MYNIWFFSKKSELIQVTDFFIMTDIYTDFVNHWKKMSFHIYNNLKKLLSEWLTEKTHIYEKELDSEYEFELNINIYKIKSISDYFSICHSCKFKALHLEIQNWIITNNIINNSNKSDSLRIMFDKSVTSKLSSVRSWSLTSEQKNKNQNRDENKVFSNHK